MYYASSRSAMGGGGPAARATELPRVPSRRPCTFPGGGDGDGHAELCEHVDEGVEAEEADPAGAQVTDARLGDAEELGGLLLGEFAALEFRGDADHEVCAEQQADGFGLGEAHIGKDVAGRAVDFVGHGRARVWRARTTER